MFDPSGTVDFGGSVTIHENGWAAVGDRGYSSDAGRVHLLVLDDKGEIWELHSTLEDSAPNGGDEFGVVALDESDQMIQLVVGAPGDNSDAGSAMVYNLGSNYRHERTLQTDVQTDGRLGNDVDVDVDRFIASATGADTTGAAYIFTHDPSDGTWSTGAGDKLQPTVTDDETFGASVAISGDTALVSAPGADGGSTDEGRVVVFDDDAPWAESQVLVSSTPASENQFGFAVDLDGDVAVVGSPGDGGGAAHIFTRAGTFTETVRFEPNDGPADLFGWNVAVSGNYVAVGAPAASTGEGAVYMYTFNGGNWESDGIVQADTPITSSEFGSGVAFEGDYLVVGAYGEDNYAGSVYVFQRTDDGPDIDNDSEWTQLAIVQASDREDGDSFGQAVAIEMGPPVQIVTGAAADDDQGNAAGAAYVFAQQGPSWVELAKFAPDSIDATDVIAGGAAVTMDHNFIVVGSTFDDTGADDAGRVFVFQR